jgi:hypothetical protein
MAMQRKCVLIAMACLLLTSVSGGSDAGRAGGVFAAGTAVQFWAGISSGGIIGVARPGTQLDLFRDDCGTDLLRSGTGRVVAQMSDAGNAAVDRPHWEIFVNAPGVPAPGAASLHLRGTLVLSVADHEAQITADRAELKTGETFRICDVVYTVTKTGGTSAQDPGNCVTIEPNQDARQVDHLSYVGDDGRPIDVKWAGNLDYAFPPELDHVKVVASVWQHPHDVAIPIDIRTGMARSQ